MNHDVIEVELKCETCGMRRNGRTVASTHAMSEDCDCGGFLRWWMGGWRRNVFRGAFSDTLTLDELADMPFPARPGERNAAFIAGVQYNLAPIYAAIESLRKGHEWIRVDYPGGNHLACKHCHLLKVYEPMSDWPFAQECPAVGQPETADDLSPALDDAEPEPEPEKTCPLCGSRRDDPGGFHVEGWPGFVCVPCQEEIVAFWGGGGADPEQEPEPQTENACSLCGSSRSEIGRLWFSAWPGFICVPCQRVVVMSWEGRPSK